jgi:hypothetical protein
VASHPGGGVWGRALVTVGSGGTLGELDKLLICLVLLVFNRQ